MAQATPAGRTLKTWLARVLQLALTVAVTWFILDRVGLGMAELAEIDRSRWIPNPALALASSLLLLLAYFASAAIWGLMVTDLGGPRLPARAAISIFMIANLGRYLPGKVWQIAGLAALAKGRGVPPSTAAAAAVLGQGIALVAAATVGIGAFVGGPDPYRRWGLIAAVLVASAIGLLAVPAVFRLLASWWFRITRAGEARGLNIRHGLRWLGLYTANWVVYALSFWVLALSLGLEGAPVPIASAFAAAYVLGYVMVFAPAGLGPREGFLIVFLTPHLGAAPSGVIAVVARLWTTVVELLPAAVFWLSHVLRPVPASGDGARPGRTGIGRSEAP